MKIVGIWSPRHQLGSSAISAAISGNIGLNYKLKGLLTHNQYIHSNLENSLLREDTNSSNYATFKDIGIDALERLLLANKLNKNEVKNYTTSLIHNRLDLLVGSSKERVEDYKLLSKRINIIFSIVKEAYDLTVIDLNSGVFSDTTHETIRQADYVIVVLNQNQIMLNNFFTKDKNVFHSELENKNYCVLINNYDPDSKYTLSYIKKLFKPTVQVFAVPYNTKFKDSISDNSCLDYLYFNNYISPKDSNYEFTKSIKDISEHTLKQLGFINTDVIKNQAFKINWFDRFFNIKKYKS